MSTSPLVSVVVPCYNVERYLAKCLDSLLGQDYKNLEIVLINDGSTDSTPSICQSYADKCPNVRYVSQDNKGQSVAKSVGVELATGEYVTFVDSDDWVEPDYVSCLYNDAVANGALVAMTSYRFAREGDARPARVSNVTQLSVMSGSEAVDKMLYQDGLDTTAWGKLYARSLWNGVSFPTGLSFDDLPTIYKLLLKSPVVTFRDYPTYNYLLRADSIEGCAFSQKKYDSMNAIISQMQNDDSLASKREAVDCRLFCLMFRIFLSMPHDNPERQPLWTRIKSLRSRVISNPSARRKAKFAAYLSLLGPSITLCVYKLIKTR